MFSQRRALDAAALNRASRGSSAQPAGVQLCGEKPRTSTGHLPFGPAAARTLRQRESCRSARFCARFRDGRPRLLLTFVGHPLSKISDRLKSDARCKNYPAGIGRAPAKEKVALQTFLSRGSPGYSYRSFIRIAFEARVLFRPAMQLAAGRTLDGIHLLDGRSLERLGIHREPSVDHFSGRRTLDQYAVHTFLGEHTLAQVLACMTARRVPPDLSARLPTSLPRLSWRF